MSDDQTDPSTASLGPSTQSLWDAQYLQTATLGGLVFVVLPAAYYFIGLRAAALVTLVSLFLVVYFTQLAD